MRTAAFEDAPSSADIDSKWRPLLRLGGGAAVFVLIMMPIQTIVFLAIPPPATHCP